MLLIFIKLYLLCCEFSFLQNFFDKHVVLVPHFGEIIVYRLYWSKGSGRGLWSTAFFLHLWNRFNEVAEVLRPNWVVLVRHHFQAPLHSVIGWSGLEAGPHPRDGASARNHLKVGTREFQQTVLKASSQSGLWPLTFSNPLANRHQQFCPHAVIDSLSSLRSAHPQFMKHIC